MLKLQLNGQITSLPDRPLKYCDTPANTLSEYEKYSYERLKKKQPNPYNPALNPDFDFSTTLHPRFGETFLEYQARGKKEKKYKINYLKYRQIFASILKSHAVNMDKMIFLTLTLPKPRNGMISAENLNKCFSKFIDNMKQNFQLKSYIAVRERGEENGRLHYHFIASIPFVPFSKINKAWCSALSEYFYPSNNAISSAPKNVIIKDALAAAKYVSKYLSSTLKAKEENSRVLFHSHDLTELAVDISEYNVKELLKGFKYERKTFEFCTIYNIDKKELKKFLKTVVFPLFGYEYRRGGALKHVLN